MGIYNLLDKIHLKISKALIQLSIFMLFVMLIIITIQVFFRYLLSAPIFWIEELAIYLMVILTFCMYPTLIYSNRMIAMTLLLDKFHKKRIGYLIDLFVSVLILFNGFVWLPYALILFQGSIYISANQLPINRGILHVIIPISITLSISIGFQKLFRSVVCLINTQKHNIFYGDILH